MNDRHLTFANHVCIRLDAENDRIKLKNGCELFIVQDDKDVTVSGVVAGLPSKLYYSGEVNNGMPWLCDMELRMGDRVIIYYLSVVNALKQETQKYFMKDGERFVFIPYSSIYAKVIDGKPFPINGYCLIEPCEDPYQISVAEKMKKIGLTYVGSMAPKRTNTHVVFGVVKYVSAPIKEYAGGDSDEGVDVKAGDKVVMKKITDVLLQYETHSKIDDKKPYYRVQRRHIYAKV